MENYEFKEENYITHQSSEDECSTQEEITMEKIIFDSNLPDDYQDVWDEFHVKMPCSSFNTYRRRSQPEKKLNKWYLIGSILTQPITNPQELSVNYFFFLIFF